MKKIRLFIVSSSLVLAAWLGASFMTEVQAAPEPDQTAKSSAINNQDGQNTTSDGTAEAAAKATLPVAHFK